MAVGVVMGLYAGVDSVWIHTALRKFRGKPEGDLWWFPRRSQS